MCNLYLLCLSVITFYIVIMIKKNRYRIFVNKRVDIPNLYYFSFL